MAWRTSPPEAVKVAEAGLSSALILNLPSSPLPSASLASYCSPSKESLKPLTKSSGNASPFCSPFTISHLPCIFLSSASFLSSAPTHPRPTSATTTSDISDFTACSEREENRRHYTVPSSDNYEKSVPGHFE